MKPLYLGRLIFLYLNFLLYWFEKEHKESALRSVKEKRRNFSIKLFLFLFASIHHKGRNCDEERNESREFIFYYILVTRSAVGWRPWQAQLTKTKRESIKYAFFSALLFCIFSASWALARRVVRKTTVQCFILFAQTVAVVIEPEPTVRDKTQFQA